METVGLLRRLGFAEYEAKAYRALLLRSPLNGYELAKASGVPRADVYSVLQRLEERGAVLRLESEPGVRYAPVPPDEVIGRLERSYRKAAEEALQALNEVTISPDHGQVWNVESRGALLEHAKGL